MYQNTYINNSFISENNITLYNHFNTYSNSIFYDNYIKIDSVNIYNVIKDGNMERVINENNVHIEKRLLSVENRGNIMLAGHNNKSVFSNIHNMNIGDTIEVKYESLHEYFSVSDIFIIDKNDVSIYKYNDDELIVTLITCMKDNNYRKVIIGKKQ